MILNSESYLFFLSLQQTSKTFKMKELIMLSTKQILSLTLKHLVRYLKKILIMDCCKIKHTHNTKIITSFEDKR